MDHIVYINFFDFICKNSIQDMNMILVALEHAYQNKFYIIWIAIHFKFVKNT
jgi:hypothetical protein